MQLIPDGTHKEATMTISMIRYSINFEDTYSATTIKSVRRSPRSIVHASLHTFQMSTQDDDTSTEAQIASSAPSKFTKVHRSETFLLYG